MREASLGWLMERLRVSRRAIDTSFEARFRMQKAAFLLKHLNVEPFSSYRFGLYIHGPYSTTLAQQYYAIERIGGRSNLDNDTIEKLDWFMDHKASWIELASAILSIKDSNPRIGEAEVFSTLTLSKPWVDRVMFNHVHRELGSHRLVG